MTFQCADRLQDAAGGRGGRMDVLKHSSPSVSEFRATGWREFCSTGVHEFNHVQVRGLRFLGWVFQVLPGVA